LDPEIIDLLAALPPERLRVPSMRNLDELRAQSRALQAQEEPSDAVERTDYVIAGSRAAPHVRLRVHRPIGTPGAVPAIFSIHGGGYVRGSYENDNKRFDEWCPKLGCVGVSVEYRLAPETPYPGALEDCYAALGWLHEHAPDLGITLERSGIFGASAGGGLAATLAILSRDRGEFPIAFQLLQYPMLDDQQVTDSSKWDVPIWKPAANAFGWRAYLGDLYGSSAVPGTAAAARATDLTGLPPTFLMVGSADGFCDEVLEYGRRLNHAGVPVELHLYPGAPHGFDLHFPGAALSFQARQDMFDWLLKMISPRFA
jgi:acetyl esterase/lipase